MKVASEFIAVNYALNNKGVVVTEAGLRNTSILVLTFLLVIILGFYGSLTWRSRHSRPHR